MLHNQTTREITRSAEITHNMLQCETQTHPPFLKRTAVHSDFPEMDTQVFQNAARKARLAREPEVPDAAVTAKTFTAKSTPAVSEEEGSARS